MYTFFVSIINSANSCSSCHSLCHRNCGNHVLSLRRVTTTRELHPCTGSFSNPSTFCNGGSCEGDTGSLHGHLCIQYQLTVCMEKMLVYSFKLLILFYSFLCHFLLKFPTYTLKLIWESWTLLSQPSFLKLHLATQLLLWPTFLHLLDALSTSHIAPLKGGQESLFFPEVEFDTTAEGVPFR